MENTLTDLIHSRADRLLLLKIIFASFISDPLWARQESLGKAEIHFSEFPEFTRAVIQSDLRIEDGRDIPRKVVF